MVEVCQYVTSWCGLDMTFNLAGETLTFVKTPITSIKQVILISTMSVTIEMKIWKPDPKNKNLTKTRLVQISIHQSLKSSMHVQGATVAEL